MSSVAGLKYYRILTLRNQSEYISESQTSDPEIIFKMILN